MSIEILNLTYMRSSSIVKPPMKYTNNAWVLYAHLLSESGRSIQAVIPPRTVRVIHTGLTLIPPLSCKLKISLWPDHALASPPLILLGSNVDFELNLFAQCNIHLYNAGHESLYLRHEAPIALVSLEKILPAFTMFEQTTSEKDVNLPSKRP